MQFTGIIRVFLIPLGLTLLVACGSEQNLGPEFSGSEEFPGGAENNGSSGSGSDDPAAVIPTTVSGLFAALETQFPAADSESFVAPTGKQQTEFYELIERLLAGQTSGHDNTMSSLGTSLLSLAEGESDGAVLALRAGSAGTYLVRPGASSNLIIELPHPAANSFAALRRAATLFTSLQARALFIAGTHPCANQTTTSCTAVTGFCGNGPRVSDVSHSVGTFYHVAHQVVDDTETNPQFLILSPHETDNPSHEIIVSNGSGVAVGSFAYINRLASFLADQVADDVTVGSCNRFGDTVLGTCARDNTQARYSNGSDDACQAEGTAYSGRILYLATDLSVTENLGDDPIVQSVQEIF